MLNVHLYLFVDINSAVKNKAYLDLPTVNAHSVAACCFPFSPLLFSLTPTISVKRVEKGQIETIGDGPLTRDLLDTNKCYLLDCGAEVFVWMGRSTPLDDRKSASSAAEVKQYSYLLGIDFSCYVTLIPLSPLFNE